MFDRLRLLPLFLAGLLLQACGPTDIAAGIATLGGMAVGAGASQKASAGTTQMDHDDLQQRVKFATATFDRTTEAFESGKLPTSTSPDTAHPKFCEMVILDLAQVGANDVGGEAVALTCRTQHALREARSAYENNNPDAFRKHLTAADGFIDQLNAILAKAKGAPTP